MRASSRGPTGSGASKPRYRRHRAPGCAPNAAKPSPCAPLRRDVGERRPVEDLDSGERGAGQGQRRERCGRAVAPAASASPAGSTRPSPPACGVTATTAVARCGGGADGPGQRDERAAVALGDAVDAVDVLLDEPREQLEQRDAGIRCVVVGPLRRVARDQRQRPRRRGRRTCACRGPAAVAASAVASERDARCRRRTRSGPGRRQHVPGRDAAVEQNAGRRRGRPRAPRSTAPQRRTDTHRGARPSRCRRVRRSAGAGTRSARRATASSTSPGSAAAAGTTTASRRPAHSRGR